MLRLRTPTSAPPTPPAPPSEAPRRPALQADAEGYYIPGYRFTVNRFRLISFTLRPEALVTFAETATGTERSMGCVEALIRADLVRLRCDYPHVGMVSIDGRFLTRVATDNLDRAVVSAVVTVRNTRGEILYNARDSFTWHPND